MLNDIRFFHENEGEKKWKLIDNELSQIFILSHFPFLLFVVVNIFFSLAPLFSPILIWLFRIPAPHHAAAASMLLIWFSDLLIQQQHQRSMSIDDEEWRPKMHKSRKIVLFSAVFCGVIPSSRSKMNQRVSPDKSQMGDKRKSVNCEQIDTVVARRETGERWKWFNYFCVIILTPLSTSTAEIQIYFVSLFPSLLFVVRLLPKLRTRRHSWKVSAKIENVHFKLSKRWGFSIEWFCKWD